MIIGFQIKKLVKGVGGLCEPYPKFLGMYGLIFNFARPLSDIIYNIFCTETTVDDHVTGVTSEPTAPSQTRSTSISSTSTSSTSTTTTSTTSTTFSTYSTADSLSTAETEENTDSGGRPFNKNSTKPTANNCLLAK